VIGETWRSARSAAPPGHLDAAGCNVPSDTALDAVIGHLRLERERGGYVAAPGLHGPRTTLAALVGAGPGDVAFLESGTAAMAALLGGWRLPPGARVGFTRSEYGSTLMLLQRLAETRGWKLVELPSDGDSRLDLDALASRLAAGLDLVTLPHVASHRGVVQPVRAIGELCRDAGVPLVLDVCQSLGQVDTGGAGATAYVGTSRKWLAGPRGVGFLIVPGLTADPAADLAADPEPYPGLEPEPDLKPDLRADMDAAAPALGGHVWAGERPSPRDGAIRYESSEAGIAARVGLGVAVQEHVELGPSALHGHLASLGGAARHLLDGRGGWRVVEPLDEPSAIVTLRPPPGVTVEETAARAAAEALLVGRVPVARAPLDLREPVLRVSPPPGTPPETLARLARVLDG
jgi:pyridoxal 5-phosphate dependent beta-lyase